MHDAADAWRRFVELGGAIVGLAVLAQVANRWGLSTEPLYLLAGLAFGNGGRAPLNFSRAFAQSGRISVFSCSSSCLVWSTPGRI
jgi:monovalent cation:H+ antiporter-2, CPA2 family